MTTSSPTAHSSDSGSSRQTGSAQPVEQVGPHTPDRRRFLGYLLAAPTLMAAAQLGDAALAAPKAAAAIPSNPQAADAYDLNDALTDAARPTSNLISVQVNPDGTASFALPRTEVGQGITTAIAMLIAEEMDLALDKVDITLADARPELIFNQLTGGSNTMNAMYTPVRVAAAIAKGRLLDAAAAELQEAASRLTSHEGVISAPNGKKLTYGSLAETAASRQPKQVSAQLKPESQFRIVGRPQNRIDALDIVTGRKEFTMDLDVPGAKPTMVCRPPTINGTPKSVRNLDAVRNMPGITDVAPISTGVAVRGETFGQCIDAVRALDVRWNPGPVDDESDDTVLQKLKAATPPAVPAAPLTNAIDAEFTFAFASNSALEPNCAIADVKRGSAEIWSSLKVPITAQQEIAQQLRLPQSAVKVHVTLGGGSFGRKLFHDAASEAAEASQKIGKPVKLMWHRADDFRQGRTHPMSYSRIRATYTGGNVRSYEQHHTSVRTSFTHGLGEIITATASRLPSAGLGLCETIFELTQTSPYDFGATKQLLNETNQAPQYGAPRSGFNTGSMRNVYSPNVCCAQELVVDQLAAKMGKDPYEFRRAFAKDDQTRAVLDKAAEVGNWGRSLPAGVAQGIALHREYKDTMCALVEIDCRPETVNRRVRDGRTGPRVTRALYVIIPGRLAVNPRGMEAMMMGGVMDGIALALTSSLHLRNGYFLEASWDNYFYTRQWNTPPELQIVLMPGDPNGEIPGGGEAGVAASFAATACAYGRATGTMPTYFPINHNDRDLGFEPYPQQPSVPESPTDGLKYAY
jgi:isoquinoline 1-oxidoreductase beta subunit